MRIHRHKYNAVQTVLDGIKFPSKKHARYYSELKLRQRDGEIIFFLREVAFDLPGKVRMWVDFQEFHADGTIHFIDVKGMKTQKYIIKKKMVEALFPIEIEER